MLFHSNQPWIKRDIYTFDVTMGAYDGAEICLYLDDGLSVSRNISGQQVGKHKK